LDGEITFVSCRPSTTSAENHAESRSGGKMRFGMVPKAVLGEK